MKRKKEHNSSKEAKKSQEKAPGADFDDVYQISSGDEDCSKGMKSMNQFWDINLICVLSIPHNLLIIKKYSLVIKWIFLGGKANMKRLITREREKGQCTRCPRFLQKGNIRTYTDHQQ